MEEFQVEKKSSVLMGIILVIVGALVTLLLYFGIARLGFFSFWASGVGVSISIMGYNHFAKSGNSFGLILSLISNALALIYGEFLDGCAELSKSYDISMTDLMFNTELLKEALTTGSFWTYPGIGIAIMLFIGFANRKANFSDEDDK